MAFQINAFQNQNQVVSDAFQFEAAPPPPPPPASGPVAFGDLPAFYDQDNLVDIRFEIVSPQNALVDITGAVVHLLIERVGAFDCVVLDGPNGLVGRQIQAADMGPGTYRAQIRLVIGGVTFHTQIFKLSVGEIVGA